MPPSEVRTRAWRVGRSYTDDLTWRYARSWWRHTWEPSEARLLWRPPLLDGPLGPLDEERVQLLGTETPNDASAILERGAWILDGRVAYFGYPEVQLDRPPDYSLDPMTGRRWPDVHASRLDYRVATVGDPKWIWELNRLQELPLLALAWRLSGSERYATAATAQMQSWIASSAPGRGIAWSNAFEPALRAISLALTHDALRGSAFLDRPTAIVNLRALWQHATYTSRELSLPSSANNHLAGEFAGIAVVGLLAPELRDADTFVERGLNGLAAEAELQVLPDGMGAEQAFAYHVFVLDLILLVIALAEQRRVPAPPGLSAAVVRAADALGVLLARDEPEPSFGDSDDGRAFVLDAEELRSGRRVAASLAAATGARSARRVARALDPASIVLFGDEGRSRFHRTTSDDEPGNALLPDAGLAILRRAGLRATVDVGPLGYLSLAAHGHADALSITLSRGVMELIVDPGTGSYFGDSARRAAFRGTAMHATVTVDDRDQADQAGPFLWRRHVNTTLRHFDLERGIVVAEHDGYTRLPDPVHHRRTVLATDDGILVVDRLMAREVHTYVQSWPLTARLEASVTGGSVIGTLEGVPQVTISAATTSDRAVVGLRPGGVSRRLEQVEPSWTAEVAVESGGAVSLVAFLSGAHTDVEVGAGDDGSSTQVSLLVNGRLTQIVVDHLDVADVRVETPDPVRSAP